jgi:hypothetical protein
LRAYTEHHAEIQDFNCKVSLLPAASKERFEKNVLKIDGGSLSSIFSGFRL